MATKAKAAREGHRTVGTARRIDQLGRVVLPAELRKMAGIRTGDLLDFRMVDDRITVVKVDPECAICGARENLTDHHDKHLCSSCVREISEFR